MRSFLAGPSWSLAVGDHGVSVIRYGPGVRLSDCDGVDRKREKMYDIMKYQAWMIPDAMVVWPLGVAGVGRWRWALGVSLDGWTASEKKGA